jgi:cytochrome c
MSQVIASRLGLLLALVSALAAASPGLADLSGHGGPVRSLAVSPDGRAAATGSFDYSMMLWDLRTSRDLGRMTGQDAAVGAVAFLDANRILSGSDDGTLALWDRAAASLIIRKPAHQAKISAVALSRDGQLFATAGWDRRLRLWRTADLSPIATIETTENVNALVFTRDGLLAGGGYDASLRLWDPHTNAEITMLSGHEAGINALIVLPDGKLVSGSSDQTVRLWDLSKHSEVGVLLGAEAAVLSLSAARDGGWIAAGDARGGITIWDGSGKLLRRWQAHAGPVWSLGYSDELHTLLSAGADGLVRTWQVGEDGPAGHDVTVGAGALAALTKSADPGERLFAKCAACHTLTVEGGNKAGPTLHGLFGRRAGTVAGYPYSPALRDSTIIWTEQTVDRLFALGPQTLVPGSKMPLQRMPDASERAALIAFLQRSTR